MPEYPLQETLHTALDHHHAGRLQEAEILYQSILDQDPKHAEALHYKGVIALQADNHQLAYQLISRSLASQPDDLGALVNLATTQARLNNPNGALESYTRALALNPHLPEIHYNQGILYQELARLDEAANSYRQAIKLRAGYAEAHFNLGVVLEDLDQQEDARACFEITLTLDPGHGPAQAKLTGHN